MDGKVVKSNKRKPIIRQTTLPLHIMLIPGAFLLLVFHYAGMLGIVIAFQDFNPALCDGTMWSMFFDSPWTDHNGFGNFVMMFSKDDAMRALMNTIIIAVWKIVTMFFAPIILSLLLNEVRKSWFKRSVQTVVYLPHFLSWVILAGIVVQILSKDGIVNTIMGQIDKDYSPILFLQNKDMIRPILIITNIWKEIGWSTIIYLAAISGVDPTLYEAAVIDGANKLQQCWYITLPGMKPIIVLSMVLSLQGVMHAGFDQIFNLYNAMTYETADIIDTFVYRISFTGGQFALGAAVGLFKSIISLGLISISYWMAYKFANYEIF